MDLTEKIERYLEGLLSKKEKERFEKEIKDNIEIQHYIERRKKLEVELDDYLEKRTNEKINSEVKRDINKFSTAPLDQIDNTEKEFRTILKSTIRKKSKKVDLTFILSIAATLLLLIIVGTGLVKRKVNQSSDKIYASLYNSYFLPESDSMLILYKSGQGNFEIISDSDSLYEVYKNNLNQELVRSNDLSDNNLLFLAISAMQKGDFITSDSILSHIIDSENKELSEIAKWYYSLSLVIKGEKKEAVEMLNSIHNSGGFYFQKAGELIKSVNPE